MNDIVTLVYGLDTMLWGNAVRQYLISIGIGLALALTFKLFETFILQRLVNLSRKTAISFDDVIIKAIRCVNNWFYIIVAFYFSVKVLSVPTWFSEVMLVVLVITTTYQFIHILNIFIEYGVTLNQDEDDPSSDSIVQLITTVFSVTAWLLSFVFILGQFGVNITSLVAGLGIGGIAIALAVQSILGDVFDSIAIFFDKPFKVGDFIVVGDDMGTVEKIGLKTTRLRTLTGQELVVPNSELTSAHINNYKRMEERGVKFTVGLAYDTPTETLRSFPDVLKEIIERHDNIELDRANLLELGDSALLFEIMYYIKDSDYYVYTNTHEAILLGILEHCEKHQVEIAYPTQTVFVRE